MRHRQRNRDNRQVRKVVKLYQRQQLEELRAARHEREWLQRTHDAELEQVKRDVSPLIGRLMRCRSYRAGEYDEMLNLRYTVAPELFRAWRELPDSLQMLRLTAEHIAYELAHHLMVHAMGKEARMTCPACNGRGLDIACSPYARQTCDLCKGERYILVSPDH